MILMSINAYDVTNEKKYLNLADKLSQITMKNRKEDIDVINAKQIKYRKQGLSFNNRKLLSIISNKKEYENNYTVLCSINILTKDNFQFEQHYKKMQKIIHKMANIFFV